MKANVQSTLPLGTIYRKRPCRDEEALHTYLPPSISLALSFKAVLSLSGNSMSRVNVLELLQEKFVSLHTTCD